MSDILKRLSEPMPYRWRVQNKNKERTKAKCAAYVDARDVQNRLDEVFGVSWECAFEQVGEAIKCTIGVTINGVTVMRQDFSERICSDKNDNMYDQAYKSAASEAFKRAACMFGVGRFLYSMSMVDVKLNDKGYPCGDNGEPIYDLTEYINKKLKSPELGKVGTARISTPSTHTVTAQKDAPITVNGAADSGETTEPALATASDVDRIIKLFTTDKEAAKAEMAKYKFSFGHRNVLNKLAKQ